MAVAQRKVSQRPFMKRRKPYQRKQWNVSQRPSRTVKTRDLIPQTFKTSLHYHQSIVLPSTTLLPTAFNNFSLNNPLDPDVTGTGHQPFGWDQFITLYNRYYVTGARMTATFCAPTKDNDTQETGPWLVGLTGSPEATFATQDADNWAEYPESDSSMLAPDVLSRQFKLTYDPIQVGIEKYDKNSTLTNTTFSRQFYGRPWIFNMGVTAATNVLCHVHIEYDIEFTEPKALTRS